MSDTDDTAARLVAQMDQAKAIDAKVLGGFYKELKESGMTEEQAFELTREWLLLTLSVEEAGEDE